MCWTRRKAWCVAEGSATLARRAHPLGRSLARPPARAAPRRSARRHSRPCSVAHSTHTLAPSCVQPAVRAATLWTVGRSGLWVEAASWRVGGAGHVTVPYTVPAAVWLQAAACESSGYDLLPFVPEPRDSSAQEVEPRKLLVYLLHSRRRVVHAVLSVEADRDTRLVLAGSPPETVPALKLLMAVALSRMAGQL
mmetsp:Transcript_20996/g.56524  ORF Transcript_20996/g.56524 Transcript_20996/m.56524 type:complete len:194 (+) Transcript_20996:340-921(+)